MINFKDLNRLQVDMIAILKKLSIEENTIEYIVNSLPYEKQVIKMSDYLMSEKQIDLNKIINKTLSLILYQA